MTNKWLFVSFLLVLFLAVFIAEPVLAQSATMTAPVIRNKQGQVIITTRISSFASGGKYRIGIGCAAEQAPPAKVEVFAGKDNPLPLQAKTWTQKNTKDWWQVEPVQTIGFFLDPSSLPDEVLLRITIAKTDADKYDKMYIFVSKDYGGDTWYLEDGVELEKNYW